MKLVSILLIVTLVACDNTINAPIDDLSHYKGSWLLVEHGYSPGGGYVTEPVPGDPPQTLTFLNDREIANNVQGYEQFRFFKLLQDSLHTKLILYKSLEDLESSTENNSKFFVEREGEVLKLRNEGCIEGCHLGFKKLTGDKR